MVLDDLGGFQRRGLTPQRLIKPSPQPTAHRQIDFVFAANGLKPVGYGVVPADCES